MTKTKQFFLGFSSSGKVETADGTKLLTDDNNPIKSREIFIKGKFFTPEDNFLYIKNIFMRVEELPLQSEMYQLFLPINDNNIKSNNAKLFKFHRIEQGDNIVGVTYSGPFYKYKITPNSGASIPIISTTAQDKYFNKINGLSSDTLINYAVDPKRNGTYYSLSTTSQLHIDNCTYSMEIEPKIGNDQVNVPIQYEKEIINPPMSYTSDGFDILKDFKFYFNNDKRYPIYPFMDGKKTFQFEANETQKIFSLTFDETSIYNIIGYSKYKNKKKTGEYYSKGRLRLTLTYEASE